MKSGAKGGPVSSQDGGFPYGRDKRGRPLNPEKIKPGDCLRARDMLSFGRCVFPLIGLRADSPCGTLCKRLWKNPCREETKMKKLITIGALLAFAAMLVGCGKKSERSSGTSENNDLNPREKIVQDFCAALRSCDSEILSNVSRGLNDGTRVKPCVDFLLELSRSGKSVKTKLLRSYKDEKIDFSIIEATCDIDTLYFWVGHKKDGKGGDEDKIVDMTTDRERIRNVIHRMEEMENREGKKEPTGVPPVATAAPTCGETKIFTLPGGVRMEMVYVAPGSFQMGSSSGNEDETPHRVRLTKGYWIGKYPVTQAQWSALVSGTGVSFDEGRPVAWFSKKGGGSDIVSGMDTSDFPMEGISWNDCKALVDALNKADRAGRRWSLPTEAQWEFAARGGNKSRGYTYSGGNNLDAVGWYYENSGMRRLSDSNWEIEDLKSNRCRPHSVKEKDIGNELGIVGMSGNVWEWCNDWYDSDYYSSSPTEDPQGPASGEFRVLRGGGWYDDARNCRSANRYGNGPGLRYNSCGFRLCCSAGPRE